jgi:signal transduction histidine kinase
MVAGVARSTRGTWVITVGVLMAVGTLTVLIVALPQLRFVVSVPRFRLSLEAGGALLAFLTGALAYLQFSLTGSRRWMLIAVAFGLLAVNRVTFGIVVPPGVIGSQTDVYLWTTARLVIGGLLVAASFGDAGSRSPGRPLRVFATVAVGAVVGVALVEWLVYAFRESLPSLFVAGPPSSAEQLSGVGGLTPTAWLIALAGTALYLVAAGALLTRTRRPEPAPTWLPSALVIAGFSHIHYALAPTVFTSYISTGDLLRLAFSAILLVGLLYEVRRVYLLERARASELEVAYEAERARSMELEAVDRAKAELFGIVTHELLHPVAALRGFALTLKRYWRQLDQARRDDMLERLATASVHLRDLAEESAAAIRLETDMFSVAMRHERAVDLVRRAAEVSHELGGRLNVRVAPGAEEAVVDADPARVMQVFRNLLSNAVKYGDAGTPVELAVERDRSEVVFSVIDQGPGISPEDVPRLFQRFSRLSAPGQEGVRGAGLGLYICRRIVETHGGRIWVDSEPGTGSTFRFALAVVEGR